MKRKAGWASQLYIWLVLFVMYLPMIVVVIYSFNSSRYSNWEGFSWISNDDDSQSVIAFRRFDHKSNEIIAVCNFLPVKRENYRIGVPYAGVYEEIFTSDKAEFGGTGFTNGRDIKTEKEPMHGFEQSISLTLPENTVFFLRCRRKAPQKKAKAPAEKKPEKAEKNPLRRSKKSSVS